MLTADDVGAVQQGGGTGIATNKVYLGWDGSKLIVQVDESSLGKVFCERFPPTAGQCGAFPAEGGTVGSKGITTPGLFVNNHSLGAGSQGIYIAWNEQSGRGESDLICNAGSGLGGFIFRTVNGDNTKELG
ncbi:hypothetical protein EH228_00170 [Erwinia endophytica]|uniref:hypothetical protein n=1 Tax=Erwinia endophytica TaxID=1563158 RepID=UPI001266048F|nr:hypothetical protein [Erwinia endophytica]KAB8313816.1 hypothetical protein EH228_00170 [Erwinia endophytica]